MTICSQSSDTHLFKGFKYHFELLQLPTQFTFLVQLMFLYIQCLIQLIHQIPDIWQLTDFFLNKKHNINILLENLQIPVSLSTLKYSLNVITMDIIIKNKFSHFCPVKYSARRAYLAFCSFMLYFIDSKASPLSASLAEEYSLSRHCCWRLVWNRPPSELLLYWRMRF